MPQPLLAPLSHKGRGELEINTFLYSCRGSLLASMSKINMTYNKRLLRAFQFSF